MKVKVNFPLLTFGIGLITIAFIATYYYSFGHDPSRDNLFAYMLVIFSLLSGSSVVGAYKSDSIVHYAFEDVKDGTEFKILHMTSVTESTSTITMVISIWDDSYVYILKTTADRFYGSTPETGKEYKKTMDAFYELKYLMS